MSFHRASVDVLPAKGDPVMKMNIYVNFHGSCAEAFRYYEKHLGAKIGMMMTHSQSPEQSRVNPDWSNKVLHGRLAIADTELMAADIPNAEPMRSILDAANGQRC